MSTKNHAGTEVVMAFMEAVFPDAPQLATVFFDEEHTLRTATELIHRLRNDLRKSMVKADGYREAAVAGDTDAHEQFRTFATWVVMQVATHNEALADAISAEAGRIYNVVGIRRDKQDFDDVADEIAFVSRSGPRNE